MGKEMRGFSKRRWEVAFSFFIGALSILPPLAYVISTVGQIRVEDLMVSGIAGIALSALIMFVQQLLSTHASNIETLKDQVTLAYMQALESSGINPALAKNKLHA